MGGRLVDALRIAASFATVNHSGVAIFDASPQLKPDQIERVLLGLAAIERWPNNNSRLLLQWHDIGTKILMSHVHQSIHCKCTSCLDEMNRQIPHDKMSKQSRNRDT
jgi:hypothetical protein